MATKSRNILRVIRKLVDRNGDGEATDQDLLRRFAEQRDEEAFTTLVRRHGSMVLGVGLRLLRQRQDAEDVCQATFLVLARKAGKILWRDSVANWLYEVAYRLAHNARNAANRRKAHESKSTPRTPPDAMAEITLRDLQAILDEELTRLPRKYRTPLLLCCLEGKARDEAARCLGLPLASVKSRLEEGRELLRRRLARRGLALSLVLGSLTLLSETGRAALPSALVQATSQAALQALAGPLGTNVSANVVSLVEGGIRTMFLAKLKAVGTALALTVLFAVGAAGLTWPTAQAQAQPEGGTVVPVAGPAAAKDATDVGPEEKKPRITRIAGAKEMEGRFIAELEEVDVKERLISVREQKVLGLTKKGERVESKEKRTLLENLHVGAGVKITVDGAEAKLDDLKRGMRVMLHLEVRGRLNVTKIEASTK